METKKLTLKKIFRNTIAGMNLSMDEAAQKLKMGRTTLYDHLGRADIDEKFEQNVRTTLGINLQDLRKELQRYGGGDIVDDSAENSATGNASYDEMIAVLKAQLKQQEEELRKHSSGNAETRTELLNEYNDFMKGFEAVPLPLFLFKQDKRIDRLEHAISQILPQQQ